MTEGEEGWKRKKKETQEENVKSDELRGLSCWQKGVQMFLTETKSYEGNQFKFDHLLDSLKSCGDEKMGAQMLLCLQFKPLLLPPRVCTCCTLRFLAFLLAGMNQSGVQKI